MNITRVIALSQKALSDNSPVILTAIGATGTLYTAYLTAKATFRAAKKIDQAVEAREKLSNLEPDVEPVSTQEKVALVWKEYVPAAATATLTVTSIVAANVIGTRRAAALATAYTLGQRAIDEYREKVIEKIGEDKEDEIRQELAQDKFNRMAHDVYVVGDGQILLHDAYTNRAFPGTKALVEAAQNEINYQLNKSDYATLTEFYDKIGLAPTSVSDEMGWNSSQPLELLWAPIVTRDGKPALSYDFATVPIRDPERTFGRGI